MARRNARARVLWISLACTSAHRVFAVSLVNGSGCATKGFALSQKVVTIVNREVSIATDSYRYCPRDQHLRQHGQPCFGRRCGRATISKKPAPALLRQPIVWATARTSWPQPGDARATPSPCSSPTSATPSTPASPALSSSCSTRRDNHCWSATAAKKASEKPSILRCFPAKASTG